jgi:hypothetical protein
MKIKLILLTASLGLVAAPGVWAQSTIALSNLGTPTQYDALYSGQWLAREFTTGGSTNLNSVDIEALIVGAPTGFGLAVYSSVSGQP